MADRKKKSRTGSIAKSLNAALMRRRFLKSVIGDIAVALLVLAVWCLTVEGAYGGRVFNVSGRTFSGLTPAAIAENARNDEKKLFDGISYRFTVGHDESSNAVMTETAETYETQPSYPETDNSSEENSAGGGESHDAQSDDSAIYGSYLSSVGKDSVTVSADASIILSSVSAFFILLVALQFLGMILGHFTGRGLIKKYLRPIDDVALAAERLSSETRQASSDEIRRMNSAGAARASADEGDTSDISGEDVKSLADAINEIDDSCASIDVHETELGGLEAAVNNMLKRLDEAKKKQIRFVDDASHELRTPISVIQGYINMLDRWGKNDPKVREEAIAAIKVESAHMKTLIDQLLFLARGEMDRHVFDMKPVSAEETVAEVLDECMMIDKEHEYRMISELSDDHDDNPDCGDAPSCVTLADAAMLKQCVRILTDNAAKYTPHGGTITLKAYEDSSSVCIEVADNGIGIAKEELPHIFDRFYRGQNVRGNNAGGSGLGLSIAKWIAEQHGGRIKAVSGLDIGTKMTVILPKR